MALLCKHPEEFKHFVTAVLPENSQQGSVNVPHFVNNKSVTGEAGRSSRRNDNRGTREGSERFGSMSKIGNTQSDETWSPQGRGTGIQGRAGGRGPQGGRGVLIRGGVRKEGGRW